jgi:hypothetical protein
MLLAPQFVTVAVFPLNLTVLLPCVDPKFDPEIVMEAPTAPDVGDKLLILGAANTVKLLPLLAVPETVTTTLPVVAPLGTVAIILVEPQLVTVAVVPLNLTVLLPCVEPKPEPAIVTEAPTAPDVGVRLVIDGAAVITWALASRKKSEKRAILRSFRVSGVMSQSSDAPEGARGRLTCKRPTPGIH